MEKRAEKYFSKKTACRVWGELFTSAYLLLMFGVYPFYMKQGYVDIGEAKYHFFIYSSLAAAGILGAIGLILGIQIVCQRIKKREPYLICWDKLSAVDLVVMFYATEIFISYVFSDYRSEALWGTEGWHMGFVPHLVLCVLYFLISRFWDGRAYIWYVGMAASSVVFLLGILDRFSIYLIPLKIRQPDFISTLGNINWFCGYLTVLAPIGICRFMFSGKGKENKEENSRRNGGHDAAGLKWKKQFAGGYVIIAFMAGFCQGSSSIFLFLGALFYILLWMAVEEKEGLSNWCLLVVLWCLSAQLVRAMRQLIPDGYNYDTDNLCAYLTDSNVTLIIGAAVLVLFLYLNRQNTVRKAGLEAIANKEWDITASGEEKKMKNAVVFVKMKEVRRVMTFVLGTCVILWMVLTCLNTWRGGLLFPKSDFFLLNEDWGNGRGAALWTGFQMYREMPFANKLFGIGPDCFSAYVYSLPETAKMLRENFGADRLTNAHNELLTSLINTGIAGVILYLGIFLSFIKRHLKKETFASKTAIVCILCYLIHNMVSFAQVLNLPYVFLILAMAEGERRGKNEW